MLPTFLHLPKYLPAYTPGCMYIIHTEAPAFMARVISDEYGLQFELQQVFDPTADRRAVARAFRAMQRFIDKKMQEHESMW